MLYAIVDIETTGSNPRYSKVIEIAILTFDGNTIVDEYSTLIHPESFISSKITYITGINNEMVSESPKFYEVAKEIYLQLKDKIFVAHNVNFDFGFLKKEFEDLGFPFNQKKLCTVRLARKYLPGYKSYSLGNICNDLKIPITNRHRAMGDAKATVKLFEKILQKTKLNNQDFLLHNKAKKFVAPPFLDENKIHNTPNVTGVYYLKNKNDEIIYIGKSKKIKDRICQHFQSTHKSNKNVQLKNEVCDIDFIETGSDLLAQIYECNEITKFKPIFNTRSKRRLYQYGVEIEKKQIESSKHDVPILHIKRIKDCFDPQILIKSKKASISFIESILKRYPIKSEYIFHNFKPYDDFKMLDSTDVKLINLQENLLLQVIKDYSYPFKNFYMILKGRNKLESCLLLFEDNTFHGFKFFKKSEEFTFDGITKITETQEIKNLIINYTRNHHLKVYQIK